MSDINPAGVGRAVEPGEQGCGYTGRLADAQPPCGEAVVAHLLVLSAEYGTVSLRACDTHAGIAQRSGEVLADHVHVAGCDDPVTEEHWQPQPDPTSLLDRSNQQPGPAADLIGHAASIIAAKKREPHTAPYQWAGALWEAGMLHAPGSESTEALLAALAEAQRERDRLRGARIVSVVFGHHKGAPRPFAVRALGEREPQYLGAQWPDGFVVLQGPNGGAMPWRSAEAMLAAFDDVEIVWLSDELEPLAEMEQQRDEAQRERDEARRCAEEAEDALFAARADAERMRRELTDAGWASVADLHAAYVDVLERWERSEPVVEAALAMIRAPSELGWGPRHPRETRLLVEAVHAYEGEPDTYETREGTDGS